jgi:pimeloyl-ACP methyl ester carboxylesterase
LTQNRGDNGLAPALLIHGQPGGVRDWDRVLAEIGDRVPAFAVHRPGWGGRRGARGFAGNGTAAIEELDARGIERAVVVGHSFGGGVAAWLAVHHPDRVAALVLVSAAANAKALDRSDRLLAAPLIGPVASAASVAGIALVLSSPPARRLMAARNGLDEDYLRAGARLLIRPRAWRSFLIEQRALFCDLPALESRLHEIAAPTTVIAGSADRTVPPSAARVLATQIPGAELVVIEGAGHLLPHLHAGRLAELIIAAAS